MSTDDPVKKLFRQSAALEALKTALGKEGFSFLCFALQGFTRILPHTKVERWKVAPSPDTTRVKWGEKTTRRSIAINVQLVLGSKSVCLSASLRRGMAPGGVGAIQRTLDTREFDLCGHLARRLTEVLRLHDSPGQVESLRAIRGRLDEQVVASHLSEHNGLSLDVGLVFSEMRHLAEQSYENKALTYGLVLRSNKSDGDAIFPSEFLRKKRYRALSDGFRTAFEVSSNGVVLGLMDLQAHSPKANLKHFYPEWCEYIAETASQGSCGICLTRHGDILVFDSGNLRFTYRVGRWQYWNHQHVCDLFRNRARVKHVPTNVLPKVVRSIYRAALDVSFRRSGGLFVLLRNQQNRSKLVVPGDGIGDKKREPIYASFDTTLDDANVRTMSRAVLTEIAGLDGGVVISNKGRVLAYGAVLKASGRFSPSEGSRTKAAMAASRYGIAVKISSDGDIAFYERRKPFLEL